MPVKGFMVIGNTLIMYPTLAVTIGEAFVTARVGKDFSNILAINVRYHPAHIVTNVHSLRRTCSVFSP